MSLIQSPLPLALSLLIKVWGEMQWLGYDDSASNAQRGRCDEFSEDHITEMVVLSQVSKLGHNPQPIKEPQTFED